MIAELHCHSITIKLDYFPLFYDAVQTVEEIIEECLKKNIGILAVTEHDSMSGYWKAKKIIADRKLSIILVPGCEISSKDGHILAYGIEKEIDQGLSAKETIEKIHEQGGIAVAAHPFIFFYSLGNKIFDLDLDGIEGINSVTTITASKKAIAAAKKLGLPAIAASDAHTNIGVGTGRTVFNAKKIKKWEDVVSAILKKDFRIEVDYQNQPRLVWDTIALNLKMLFKV